MENYDAEMAARVWKRVRGEADAEPPRMGIQGLAAAEWAESAVYLMLSRQLQGREKAVLRQLFEEERTHADCLKGMHLLTTGKPLALRTPPPSPETPELALRKCYARTLRALKEYESRQDDPEYGHVFRHLAEEERKHCTVILELVGGMKR